MALSLHIVVPFFLVFALVDIALLSARALLSHQRHSLTLLYALMGVQEAMLLFELLTTFAPLFSTFLITAGMWGHIARLFSVFLPLWILRAFFAAFTMVYKNILIPRWSTQARERLATRQTFDAPGIRAWHAAGYGVCVVLDVLVCCIYYLAAVYVFGYLSDKTLYVPYHRRRWRHEQATCATTAAAVSEAVVQKGQLPGSTGTSSASFFRESKRQRDRNGAVGGDGRPADTDRRQPKTFPTLPPLARMPSFAQWQQQQQQHPPPPPPASATAATSCGDRGVGDGAAAATEGNHGRGAAEAAEQGRSGLLRFAPISPESLAQEDGPQREGGGSPVLPRPAFKAHHNKSSPALHASETLQDTQRAGVPLQPLAGPPPPQQPQRTSSSPFGARHLHVKPASAFVSNIPPLRLSRRFTVSREGEEGHLNQFAAALVEHGFSAQTPGRAAAAAGAATSLQGPRKGGPPSNSYTAMLPEDGDRSPAGTKATARASLRDGGAATAAHSAAHSTAHQSSTPYSGADAAFLQPPGGGVNREKASARSSFRRILSAWSGFKSGTTTTAEDGAGASPGQQASSAQMGSRCASSNDAAAALPRQPQRRRSNSLVRFAVAESENGNIREETALSVPTLPPLLPPRPRPSFRIDHTTGSVVPVSLGEK